MYSNKLYSQSAYFWRNIPLCQCPCIVIVCEILPKFLYLTPFLLFTTMAKLFEDDNYASSDDEDYVPTVAENTKADQELASLQKQ